MGASPAAMLDAAESVGRLPHALRRLVRKYALKSPEEATDSIYLRAYPFVMTLMMTVSLALFFNFVLPKYETIFKDFGTKLPPITQFVIDAMYQVGPLLAILAIASVIGWAALSLWKIVHPRSAEWNVLHRARDRVLWSLPLTRGLERDRGMADALDFIADALRAGQPMERAVDEASMLRINVMLKRQLTRWSGGLRSGSPLAESARAAGLPGLIPEMLTPARSGEQAIEVMAFLARYFDARFSRTRVLIRAAAVPVMVFVFAIIVATIALAMLAPMATLIGNMSAGSARSHWKI
jgi:type IV pilus assembly protein PilC